MSIKMHHFLSIALSSIIMLTSFAIFAVLLMTERYIVGFIIGIVGLITSAYLGHKFTFSVPAACPKCKGKAFGKKSSEERLYFECTECGHIQMTGFQYSDETTE